MTLVDDRTQQIVSALAECVAACSACAKDCAARGDADLG